MKLSVVIRTLNEASYLDELLAAIHAQDVQAYEIEIVLIDSGSTDSTLDIARKHACRITHINKKDFSFGRSLNMGSEFATGDILIFISGHCVPCDSNWLSSLIQPIVDESAQYVYGRQVGRDTTKFSEENLFRKYFPKYSKIPQADDFCNNANSALKRSVWKLHPFNEALTGLEDMELGKRLRESGGEIAYVADAAVYHIHDESWSQVKRRYEREAIALQKIMPEVHINLGDLLRYITSSVIHDAAQAILERRFFREIFGIFRFRVAQYYGSYSGNHNHRRMSQERKERYFYPKNS